MTWTTIPDGDIDPDSPITTSLVTALRDNVGAAFNGDSGRPDLVEAALTVITAGSSYRLVSSSILGAETVETSTSYVTTNQSILVPRSGTYQVSFDLKRQVATGTAYGRVYRDSSTGYSGDVAFGAEQTDVTDSYVTKTESLALNAGDVLTLYSKQVSATSSNTKNFRIESATKLHG